MAYRELDRMEIVDLVRRWQAGETQRSSAEHSGVARATVWKYLRAAQRLGLEASGPPPDEAQLVHLARLSRAAASRPGRAAPELARLERERERIAGWLGQDRLYLTRVQELLARDGLTVAYTTLRRFVRQQGLGRPAPTTCAWPTASPASWPRWILGGWGRLRIRPRAGGRSSGGW